MASGLARPTPAHQDAPFRRQGRSEQNYKAEVEVKVKRGSESVQP